MFGEKTGREGTYKQINDALNASARIICLLVSRRRRIGPRYDCRRRVCRSELVARAAAAKRQNLSLARVRLVLAFAAPGPLTAGNLLLDQTVLINHAVGTTGRASRH